MDVKSDWLSVAKDCFLSYGRQWWAWVWVIVSLLLILYAPVLLQVVGWISLATFLVFFAWGIWLVRSLRQLPADFWDPPHLHR